MNWPNEDNCLGSVGRSERRSHADGETFGPIYPPLKASRTVRFMNMIAILAKNKTELSRNTNLNLGENIEPSNVPHLESKKYLRHL